MWVGEKLGIWLEAVGWMVRPLTLMLTIGKTLQRTGNQEFDVVSSFKVEIEIPIRHQNGDIENILHRVSAEPKRDRRTGDRNLAVNGNDILFVSSSVTLPNV